MRARRFRGEERTLADAVEHLFRHLHDPEGLRCNPLVGPFFGTSDTRAQNDLATVGYIHCLIRRAAQFHRDTFSRGAHREKSIRQCAIVMESCAEKKSPQAIANSLGISLAQFFSERSEIFSLIAEQIQFVASRLLHAHLHLDDVDRRLERAAQQADGGDSEGAIRAYEEIARGAEKLIERAALVQAQASVEAMAIILRSKNRPQDENDRRQEQAIRSVPRGEWS
ncbi:MAG TPA: hypothetical protein VMF61_04070 [Candidatus Acidoferrales bacterium]|nr:hypothetical protein [Candidatus Acidoferrales bacterium]